MTSAGTTGVAGSKDKAFRPPALLTRGESRGDLFYLNENFLFYSNENFWVLFK